MPFIHDLNFMELVEQETELFLVHFPQSRIWMNDIAEVCERAEKYKGRLIDQLKAEPKLSARAIFDSYESPGYREAGAYLGAVDMFCMVMPEPAISKAVGGASIAAGFISQMF